MENPKKILSMSVLTAVVILTLAVVGPTLTTVEGQTASKNILTVPRFEPGDCVFPIPDTEKARVRCGYLIVPENRQRKNSREIKLPIIIQRSNDPNPAPDPVLRTLGGPGASSLKIVRGRRSSPWLDHRDVVIFEQRGTQYAQPALDCPEVNDVNAAGARHDLNVATTLKNELVAAKVCHDRLIREGVDLAGYNSRESAADIEDLRRVLGYQQWNLYGVSYSARLMLEVMRYYPQGIRSVAIESVLAPQVNYDEVGVDTAMRALRAGFANCAANAECSLAYPDLEAVFWEVVKKADREPVSLSVGLPEADGRVAAHLNGDQLAAWIVDYLLSNDAESAADAPLQIYRFKRGDFAALQNYAKDRLNGGSSYSLGMRYSFWCSEERPFEEPRKIAAQATKYPGLTGSDIVGSTASICDVWDVPRAQPIVNTPVRSNIPTLLLGAEYDAYTPPEWARLAGKTLPNSFYFEVPGVGHGPGFSSACARQMVGAFFDDPSKAPDATCLKAPRPKFGMEK
jgi:pimeloyl-ACP methyl ester carboxylesterase